MMMAQSVQEGFSARGQELVDLLLCFAHLTIASLPLVLFRKVIQEDLTMRFILNFCIFSVLFFINLEARPQTPRRDESYPPRDILAEYRPIREQCMADTGATEKIIQEFSDGDHLSPVEDEALKCYMNCLFHKIQVVDDTGHVHFEKLRLKVPDDLKDVGHNMIAQCENPVGANLCEKAYWLHTCFKRVDPVHYFLV
ncbi:general odorant-binding protein 83a-like [Lutzomyia longipalpis]|uniref:general odorant-binding protein 83a-like n=1 Tax=Lutzomyia longipalpis TaxID=7200 RepID=UPI00248381DD|nr:general odorant-binding protein 83a-like [Lutzomyia longipalpis]